MYYRDEVSELRHSAARLEELAAELSAFAQRVPASIPAGAWSGSAAVAWGEAFAAVRVNLEVATSKLREAVQVLNTVAAEIERIASHIESIAMASLGTGIEIQLLSNELDAARAVANHQLLDIGNSVNLTAGLHAPVPVEGTGAEVGGLSTIETWTLAFDTAGIVDPTPVSDIAGGTLSLIQGDLIGAGASAIGIIPIIGDSAKAGKFAKHAAKLEGAADTVKPLAGVGTVSGRLADGWQIRRKLVTNATFLDNGFSYTVDELGRPAVAQGFLQKLPTTERSGHYTGAIGRLGAAGDEGGHLIARVFGGSKLPFNLTPQAFDVNRSIFTDLEATWLRHLEADEMVHVTIRPSWDDHLGRTNRPDGWLVEYSVDGVEQAPQIIPNTNL